MTARLAQALQDAAQAAPGVRVPEDLWRRGRRTRRRRRIGVALACLLLIAGLIWLPVGGRTETGFAGSGPDAVPSSVPDPHLWQQTFDADPNGPVKLVFGTGHSLNLETALVLIGRDDSYRLIYLNPGEESGSLSPDGRYLLRHHLLDLTTGEVRILSEPIWGFTESVWAPDSRTAVAVIERDDGVITYGPNNEQLNDPQHADDIVLVDVATGKVRTLVTADTTSSSWQAAFSPDGRRIAMSLGASDKDQRLVVLDVANGSVQLSVPLNDRRRLAGPAAWTPDGSQVLLAYGDGCAWSAYCGTNPDQPGVQTWHVQRVDAANGKITDDAAHFQGWPSLVAWRDGEAVFQVSRDYHTPCETSTLTTAGLHPLPVEVAGHGCGTWARDLLEHGRLGGPALRPSPWQAQWWAYAVTAAFLTVAGLVLWLFVRRRNSGRARRGTQTVPEGGQP